jgi:3'(2'), 5'-bisphosphate nucleotidase
LGLGDALVPVALRAAAAIMAVYEGAFMVERKLDDSPVTQADLESQRIILDGLETLTPGVPVLAEESAPAPWTERRSWRELWVVDPLDGTREFVKRNDEFAINIALVIEHEPVLGLVAVPAQGIVYVGAAGCGAYRRLADGSRSAIRVAAPAAPLRVVGSRSHTSPQLAGYLTHLAPYEFLGVGSAVKFCRLAEGNADLYPRFGSTCEWDTAAGQALLEAAGGQVTRMDGHRLRYNCRESLINGDFVAFSDPGVLPERWAAGHRPPPTDPGAAGVTTLTTPSSVERSKMTTRRSR